MRCSATFVIALFFLSGLAQAQITFYHGFQKVLEKAKVENKLIFVDAYTTWCLPCKIMDQRVFSQPEVGIFYNENFINVKLDMEKSGNLDLVSQWNIFGFPTFLFLHPNGDIIHKIIGAESSKEKFIELGKRALNPEMGLNVMSLKFNSGYKEKIFLEVYINILKRWEKNTAQAFDSLWANSLAPSNELLLSAERNLNGANSLVLDYIITEKASFPNGVTVTDISIQRIFRKIAQRLFIAKDYSDGEYLILREKIKSSGLRDTSILLSELEILRTKILKKSN